VPIAPEKTEGPRQLLTFLGIELDTIAQVARLPQDKLDKGLQLVRDMGSRRRASLRELQSLTGFLNFTTSVVLPGKPFLRKLINLMKGLRKHFYKARITQEVKVDLALWEQFLSEYNGVSFFMEEEWLASSKLHLYTDASTTLGYGLLFGKRWVSGKWPPEMTAIPITPLELYPITLAFLMFTSELQGRSIIIHTDNEALVHVINSRKSKDNLILSLLRMLHLTCLHNNIRIKAVHIPGYLNSLADALSRLQVSRFKAEAPWADPSPTSVPLPLMPESLLRS
jgi:hypothetical protein